MANTYEEQFRKAVVLDRYTGTHDAGDAVIGGSQEPQGAMPEKDAADLHYAAAMAIENARRAGKFKPSMKWMHDAVASPGAAKTQESQNQLIDIIGMLHSIADYEGWADGLQPMKQVAEAAKAKVGTPRDSFGKMRQQYLGQDNYDQVGGAPAGKDEPFMVKRDDIPKGVSVRAKSEQEAVSKAKQWLGDGPATARRIAGNQK